jgi:hypothetical protein
MFEKVRGIEFATKTRTMTYATSLEETLGKGVGELVFEDNSSKAARDTTTVVSTESANNPEYWLEDNKNCGSTS